MQQYLISASKWLAIVFILTVNANNPYQLTDDDISVSFDGRQWIGDTHSNFVIKGKSTTVSDGRNTARISRSGFSYLFRVKPGQKLIRLHFYPISSYKGFNDLFSVEAGPYTLLSNFSASINADALGVNVVVKEFCVVLLEENYPLIVSFYPVGTGSYAFVNGIEVVSVPDTFLYCHTGDRGVEVVGENFLVYIGYRTAFEMVYWKNVKHGAGDDFRGRFGMWGAILNEKESKENSNSTWRVLVDVGFRYLVRLHFCELGLKMVENGNMSFKIIINDMVVCTNIDIVQKVEDNQGLFYNNYMVMAQGRKFEGKRDIIVSFQSKDGFMNGHALLEGFEIFKLSNLDNSLASPNPLPPARDSAYRNLRNTLSVLGSSNTVSAVVVIVISLVNIIVHMLRKFWEASYPEEEKKQTTRVTRTCRCFSLSEMHKATQTFSETFVIGMGGFGKVYKGYISDGQELVAIKRMKPDSKQGMHEFWTEVETLSELRHVNLVSLIGYCNEQNEMILVYDYMPNGTLADHLYKLARKNSNYSLLSWEERLNICIGAGRGLDYLHTGKGVLHRDVKTSNILLDETFVPKVSDFGLAKTQSVSGLQSRDTTDLKGTFGYIDPDYFKTRKLTMKSDTYAFGIVLLEVLCGRPAIDPLAGELGRNLTVWAQDNINRGEVDQILAPSLSGGIIPDSLKAFLGTVERCLHVEPYKRPTIAHVIINLEFALEQQNSICLTRNDILNFADFVPFTGQVQQSRLFIQNEITNVAAQLDNTSLLRNERTGSSDVFPHTDRKSMRTMPLSMASSHPQNMIFLSKEQSNSRMFSGEPLYERNDDRKTIKHMLTRILPFDAVWRKAKASKKADVAGISVSAPISKHTSNKQLSSLSSSYQKKKSSTEGGINSLISTPKFRFFSFSELKAATRNFGSDTVLGEGGFGRVYKGFLGKKSANSNSSGSIIAVKRLSRASNQGVKEWLAEITFLGNLSHPNLVKLLGCCLEKQELLLVYEFIVKGSLENHLFPRTPSVQILSWDIRLKILIGAARGLEYLHHALDKPVIYRDVKTSNILLDELYNAKLSDFGLAKSGPSPEHTHISTRVAGTIGYLAPEYALRGHLTVKSDVYGFGVVLLELLTGLKAVDRGRPDGQKYLIEWIKPHLNNRMKVIEFMDSHLEGNYPPKSVFQVFQLAEMCLHFDFKLRPSMNEIVETLEALEKLPREPRVRFS